MKLQIKREIDFADIDNVKKITISTSTPCESYMDDRRVMVILEHTPEAVDMAWINDGCPIRYLHGGDVIARALEVHLEGDALVSEKVIWGEGNAAQKVKADVLAKILTNISIEADYNADDCIVQRGLNGEPDTLIVKRWRPLSCAIVVNGADVNARIEREYQAEEKEDEKEEEKPEEKPEESKAEPTEEVKEETGEKEGEEETRAEEEKPEESHEEKPEEVKAEEGGNEEAEAGEKDEGEERKREEEIRSLAKRHGIDKAQTDAWIDNKTCIDEVRKWILRNLSKPLKPIQEKEKKMKYSIIRALKGNKEEAEHSVELAQKCGKEPKGIYIQRDYTDYNTTEGAGLVHTEHAWDEYVPELLSKVVLEEAGANILDGLRGKSLTIPVTTQGATGTWIAEDGTVSGAEPQTGSLTLSSSTCATTVTITHALLNSGLPQADELVTDMIYNGLARNIQKAALGGSGLSSEPAGITKLLSATEWAGGPTYADLVNLEGTIPDGIDLAKCVYVMAPATFAKLRTVAVGDHAFAAEFVNGKAYVLNRPALLTSDAPANTVIFGDFSGLYIGYFSPIDVFEDKYSGSNKLQVKVIGSVDVGIGIIANRFAVGKITASQAQAEG